MNNLHNLRSKTFLILFVSVIPLFSQANSKIFYDICPFECCQFGNWVIEDSIRVYLNEGDTDSNIFTLVENDTVIALTGNLHFLQVGKVVVLKQIYNYKPEDTLVAYFCSEEEYLVSHKGINSYVDVFWPTFYTDEEDTEENYLQKIETGEYSGKMIQRPKTVWWVQINSKNGKGWIALENITPYCFDIEEKIKGIDGCS